MMPPADRDAVYKEITPIFRSVFGNETLQLSYQLSAKDVAQWDSLSYINLIVAIEMRLGIKFGMGEIAGLANVGELVDVILKKLRKT